MARYTCIVMYLTSAFDFMLAPLLLLFSSHNDLLLWLTNLSDRNEMQAPRLLADPLPSKPLGPRPNGPHAQFVREIVIGDGAVHTADGTKIVQDVFIAATTRGTGTKSTLIVACNGKAAQGSEKDEDLYLTLFYELNMGG
ncbi:hypothetical protein S40285_09155 [Stachybotrys chlorohalonatus IBT 40285]|uniref:Uncharacterized protein n=1 Tax=Stachybotrys chlorohalonatus (strain IBT 40285) TaxID=1283841 RepID=A0A084QTB1_STAC4|nr:hypothetical protein S40285_09155 [Stachybotrys chlorohalonata IBT 40285]